MSETITLAAGVLETLPLAQASDLGTQLQQIVALMRQVAFVLAVGGVIISGLLFARGDTSAAINGLIAAGILAVSGALVQFIFSQTGDGLEIAN